MGRGMQPFPIIEAGGGGLLQVVDNGRFPPQSPTCTSRIPMQPNRCVTHFCCLFVPIGSLLIIAGHEAEIALDAQMNHIVKKEEVSRRFVDELEAEFAGRGAGGRVVSPAVPADLVDAL